MSDHSHAPNRLQHETSPYLRQHANNPVDWYPWGPEALAKSRELDRPIFLSIGYSACHWCHVMERESFEDPSVAEILNRHFVSIKVDREERPDLDQIYMSAVQILTRQGGWPMSMFLTPELEPFYGGTYFPPQDRYGRPSFKRLLLALAEAWKNRREELVGAANQLTEHLQTMDGLAPGADALGPDLLEHAVGMLERTFDSVHGGFGSAPKFPHPMELSLLLRIWKRFGNDDALNMARLTFDRMAMGGMYDHLGGGFHRYSTDERWLAPHFEKMLYDNALLTVAYLEAYQATGSDFYRRVVTETLDYVEREMTSPEGPFYSTQDADSEGEEGKFFVWSSEEVGSILGKDRADVFGYVYDVTPAGNWEGKNILHRSKTDQQDAAMLKLSVETLHGILGPCRRDLLAVRGKRIWPGRDEKILTSWNGLMIQAFALAAQVLHEPKYAGLAAKAADYILGTMRKSDSTLYRTTTIGTQPKLNAYLEDYTFLLDALVTLYEATFDPRWIREALSLSDVLIDQFWDPANGGFFYTGKNHESLIARTKDPHDSSIPSGNSKAVMAFLKLSKLTGRTDLFDKAEQTLQLFSGLLGSSPMAAGQMLMCLDFYLGPVQEFAVLGSTSDPETSQVLERIRSGFRPNKVVAFRDPKKGPTGDEIALLADKGQVDGKVTTYICKDFTCEQPCRGLEELADRLQAS